MQRDFKAPDEGEVHHIPSEHFREDRDHGPIAVEIGVKPDAVKVEVEEHDGDEVEHDRSDQVADLDAAGGLGHRAQLARVPLLFVKLQVGVEPFVQRKDQGHDPQRGQPAVEEGGKALQESHTDLLRRGPRAGGAETKLDHRHDRDHRQDDFHHHDEGGVNRRANQVARGVIGGGDFGRFAVFLEQRNDHLFVSRFSGGPGAVVQHILEDGAQFLFDIRAHLLRQVATHFSDVTVDEFHGV